VNLGHIHTSLIYANAICLCKHNFHQNGCEAFLTNLSFKHSTTFFTDFSCLLTVVMVYQHISPHLRTVDQVETIESTQTAPQRCT